MTSSAPPNLIGKYNEIFGYSDIEKNLFKCWKDGRLHHAWLFAGPKGVGKSSVAYQAARLLLTNTFENNNKLYKPKLSSVDNRIINGTHPDFKQILSFSISKDTIPVDSVRTLATFFSKTPAESTFRVAIIDAVDDMNLYGHNALLKIIEEPPNNSCIFIINHIKANIPATIRSRCKIINFNRLTDYNVEKIINDNNSIKHNKDYSSEVKLAQGSVGKAIFYINNETKNIYESMISILSNLDQDNIAEIYIFAEKISSDKNKFAKLQIVSNSLQYFFVSIIKSFVGISIENRNLVKKEKETLLKIKSNIKKEDAHVIWKNILNKTNAFKTLNLDAKFTIIDFFTNIKSYCNYN